MLLMLVALPASHAQDDNGASRAERTEQLRKQIDETRKKLDTLEHQLAVEEQQQAERENARRRAIEAEQAKRASASDQIHPDTVLQPRKRNLELSFIRNVAEDEKSVWTAPLHLQLADASWLLPLAGAMAAVNASDVSIEQRLPSNPNTIRRAHNFSNYATFSMIGATGGLWAWGHLTHNDHQIETGFLAGEAFADSFIATEAIKRITGRERPTEGNGKGQFFQGGSSFSSEHAAAAWSIASVLAHEYPGPLTKLFAYGTASAISASRIIGRDHFASDVLVGSAIGWYFGQQAYRSHHNGNLGGAEWGNFQKTEKPLRPENMGSAYVPTDSWVYPALDRLVAMGFVHTAFAGMRPWTRMECARLLEEARDTLQSRDAMSSNAGTIYKTLMAEFAFEGEQMGGGRNLGAQVESIYTRFTGISGRPLTDGYHFGETIINDYGRPYSEGMNAIGGFSARAEAGPMAFYVRGEYQHAPARPEVPPNVQAAIAASDLNPVQPSTIPPPTNRFDLLDSYFTLGVKGFQILAGKQTLWWGPGQGGALMFSDNAEPMYMVRLSQAMPVKLPSIFSWLGPMRSDLFFGKLEGHHFPPGPVINGQKFSFKPTPNLEIGFSRIGIFAGTPQPLTWGTFISNITSNSTGNPDPRLKPGDRRAGFDFSYRIPHLRNRLILYTDSLSDDDPSPFAAPRRSAMNPGIYVPQLPWLPKMDLRVESVYTDIPTGRSNNGQFIYWEFIYHDSHTNAGNLMGSWIGREGKGVQAWTTYWLSPRNTIRFGYRQAKVASDFLEGGTIQNFDTRADFMFRKDVGLSTMLQYEHWTFPLLATDAQSNFTASFQVTFWPTWGKKHFDNRAASFMSGANGN
ncbi:MAG: phosphatase PAP2 family protein [Acidobacteriaceae bacterium]|nr:phosphatase PAP2 family protein [Acidobacteriaceae bacterium]